MQAARTQQLNNRQTHWATNKLSTFSDHALYSIFFGSLASRRKKASISHECYTRPNLATSPGKRRKRVADHNCRFKMNCVQASSRGSEQVPISSLPFLSCTFHRRAAFRHSRLLELVPSLDDSKLRSALFTSL